jgi:hypothetical protein
VTRTPNPSADADLPEEVWTLADDPEDDHPLWPEDPSASDRTFRS